MFKQLNVNCKLYGKDEENTKLNLKLTENFLIYVLAYALVYSTKLHGILRHAILAK